MGLDKSLVGLDSRVESKVEARAAEDLGTERQVQEV
jgi:hypothetical protein